VTAWSSGYSWKMGRGWYRMKHVKPLSRKPGVAQQTVLEVKLEALLYYVDAGAEYVFNKFENAVV